MEIKKRKRIEEVAPKKPRKRAVPPGLATGKTKGKEMGRG